MRALIFLPLVGLLLFIWGCPRPNGVVFQELTSARQGQDRWLTYSIECSLASTNIAHPYTTAVDAWWPMWNDITRNDRYNTFFYPGGNSCGLAGNVRFRYFGDWVLPQDGVPDPFCNSDACVDVETRDGFGYATRLAVTVDPSYFTHSPEFRHSIMVHEMGHIYGLGDDNTRHQCDQSDGEIATIMKHYIPDPPCMFWPVNTDVMFSMCKVYLLVDECPKQWGDISVPAAAAADGDGDGVEDSRDNCPGVANAQQQNLDIDATGDACDTDDDGDGYTDQAENHVGTLPRFACSTAGMPADLLGSGRVNLSDVASFVAPVRRFGSSQGEPNFDVRWDVVPSGSIILSDVASLVTVRPPVYAGAKAFNGPFCADQTLFQLGEVEKALEVYADLSAAEQNGYARITDPVPNRGVWFSKAWDNTVSRTDPEGLVYDSTRRLAGAFYVLPLGAGTAPPDLFPGTGDDIWRSHSNVCYHRSTATVAEDVAPADCAAPDDIHWTEFGWTLFVWTGCPNAAGPFAETNAAICAN